MKALRPTVLAGLPVVIVLAGCGATELTPTATPTELEEGDHGAGTYTYS